MLEIPYTYMLSNILVIDTERADVGTIHIEPEREAHLLVIFWFKSVTGK